MKRQSQSKPASRETLVKHIAVTAGLAFFFAAFVCGAQQAQKQSSPPNAESTGKPSNGSGDVNTTMKNVNYHLTDKIIVHIVSLNGKLTPKADQMVVFDDRQSFEINVDSAKRDAQHRIADQ
jgi:hypothetical protein